MPGAGQVNGPEGDEIVELTVIAADRALPREIRSRILVLFGNPCEANPGLGQEPEAAIRPVELQANAFMPSQAGLSCDDASNRPYQLPQVGPCSSLLIGGSQKVAVAFPDQGQAQLPGNGAGQGFIQQTPLARVLSLTAGSRLPPG